MPDPGGMVPGPGCQRDPGIERDACTCETLRGSSGPGVVMGWLVVAGGGGGRWQSPSPPPGPDHSQLRLRAPPLLTHTLT